MASSPRSHSGTGSDWMRRHTASLLRSHTATLPQCLSAEKSSNQPLNETEERNSWVVHVAPPFPEKQWHQKSFSRVPGRLAALGVWGPKRLPGASHCATSQSSQSRPLTPLTPSRRDGVQLSESFTAVSVSLFETFKVSIVSWFP